MFGIDKFFNALFAPFRALRSTIFGIQQMPANIKGQINRAGSEARSIGSEAKQMAAQGKAVGSKAQAGAKGAQGLGGKAANGVKAAKPGKVKMGFFSRAKKCAGCGQKLHPSWEECPYCGQGKGAAPAGGGGVGGAPSASAPVGAGAPPMAAGGGGGNGGGMGGGGPSGNRTMALDISAMAPPGAGILGWFIPLEGSKTGELFEVRGRVTVGSKDDNQICVPEASISGRHCEFVGSPSGFKLNDLNSTNGTYVNDKRIQSHDLVDNDNVTLGKVRFKFKSLV